MQKVIDFLSELQYNNTKDWFEANKSRYKAVLSEFNVFAQQLIDGIASFDPSVAGLTLKDCTYRIYRDTRFSANKEPYKTHIGVFVCPKGKKSGLAGYYFHIEPTGGSLAGQNMLSAGIYMPEPFVLKSIRDEILCNGEALNRAIETADGFDLNRSNQLKRTPTGYPTDTPYDDMLRLKDLYVVKYVDNDFMTSPNLLEKTLKHFALTKPLMDILNRAATFAYENRD